MSQAIRSILAAVAIATVAIGGIVSSLQPAQAQDIFQEWDSIKAPPPPKDKVKPVEIDTKKTALLSLDWNVRGCTAEKRPRCFNALPRIEKLLNDARSHHMLVVHAISGSMKPTDIIARVAPKGDEKVVKGRGDKFSGSDLEKILKDKGIEKVVIVGTSANSAVLYTAFGAVQRGFIPIVPIDGMPSELAYQEQFTIWQIANGSQLNDKAVLTRLDMLKF